MLGEGKKNFHTKMSRSGAHVHEVACQLAWSAHPTLTIMILCAMADHRKQIQEKGLKNAVCIHSMYLVHCGSMTLFLSQPRFYLPEHAFLYGIAYDECGFIIYSFFPRVLKTDANRIPTQWGYGCTAADTQYMSIFKQQDRQARLKAMQALLVVQHHSVKLFDYFWEMTFPQELVRCHDLWDQEGLWGN